MSTPNRRFKDAIYDQFARIGKAISNPKRLELLDLLCQAPRTVEVLAEATNAKTANTSQHLQVLRSARLVESEKQGQYVVYRMADEMACRFFRSLRLLAESRLAEIDQIVRGFLGEREGMVPVDREKLMAQVQERGVIVLDVRPSVEYQAGHIPGALSVPLDELERHLSELPKDREMVAYCRGPYCVLSVEAVDLLRARGFEAVRLEDSIQDWKSRGLPVSVGTMP